METIDKAFGGNGSWSMETMTTYYEVECLSNEALAQAEIAVRGVMDEAMPYNQAVGSSTDVVTVAATESLKESSKYFDPNAASGFKTLQKLVKGLGILSWVSTGIEVVNQESKATENYAKGNTNDGWEEVARPSFGGNYKKAGGSIVVAIAAGLT